MRDWAHQTKEDPCVSEQATRVKQQNALSEHKVGAEPVVLRWHVDSIMLLLENGRSPAWNALQTVDC